MLVKIDEINLEPREVIRLIERRNPKVTEESLFMLFPPTSEVAATVWECHDGVTLENELSVEANNWDGHAEKDS